MPDSCSQRILSWRQAEKRAAELALQRKKEEAQREKERQEALKERAASFRAREASRVQVYIAPHCVPLPPLFCSDILPALLLLKVSSSAYHVNAPQL